MLVYLVIPLSFPYRPDERLRIVDRHAIHAMHVPDDRDAFKVASDLPPMDLTAWTAPPKFETFETLSLYRKVCHSRVRYAPRERRRLARAKGRRMATSVPMLEERETTFYVPTAEIDLAAVANELSVIVRRAWRCPWWRRGRPIETAWADVPARL